MRDYCSFDLPILNPQSFTFGFFEIDPDSLILLNHILLLYKCCVYSSINFSKLSFVDLLKNIGKVFDLEENIERK